jgi:hypothetical protein
MTSDGGSSFVASTFEQFCKLLSIKHHISAYTIRKSMARSSVRTATSDRPSALCSTATPEWPAFLKAVEFAPNTGYSRTLGTSPWQVVHGYPPRLPLHSALGSDPALPADDPLDLSVVLSARFLSVADEIRNIQQKIYESDLAHYSKAQKGRVDFDDGDLVLCASLALRSSFQNGMARSALCLARRTASSTSWSP